MQNAWLTLSKQQVYLAQKLLLDKSRVEHPATDDKALDLAIRHASILLLNAARQSLLSAVAFAHQQHKTEVLSLDSLRTLLGEDNADYSFLHDLTLQKDSWWSKLENLLHEILKPAKPQKTVTSDNIIAIAHDHAPDASTPQVLAIATALKADLHDFQERHHEW